MGARQHLAPPPGELSRPMAVTERAFQTTIYVVRVEKADAGGPRPGYRAYFLPMGMNSMGEKEARMTEKVRLPVIFVSREAAVAVQF